jgi:hypothetical protein
LIGETGQLEANTLILGDMVEISDGREKNEALKKSLFGENKST